MHYTLSFPNPANQRIQVEIKAQAANEGILFQLPKWRPGRYELQRFDKLIADVVAFDVKGNELKVNQLGTHDYFVATPEIGEIRLQYVFFANQRDSGGSVFDAEGIYVNPCNLLMYQKEALDVPCSLTLNIPDDYQIACGLPKEGKTLIAKDFHELADAPFFAANNLQYHSFDTSGLKVHIWFMGECKPDFGRIEIDFKAYTDTQIALFGDCPVKEYHYLMLMLPYRFRHGVEHQSSSVNTFGPGYTLMENDRYESFIELCSHEFFHTWNVKALRPADMYPYDYSKENYSALHHVTEGVTSYYGDLMLLKSGVYTKERFLKNLNFELYDHYMMPGKDFISLEKSSFNSWVNGYGVDTGIPNRKISFYTKGYIVAFLLDYVIRSNTNNQYGMDDVLKEMYQTIYKNDRGYTKEDYQSIIEKFAGIELTDFFEKYIAGVAPLDDMLKKAAKYFGWSLKYYYPMTISEGKWGIRLSGNIIDMVVPNSAAEKAGLMKGNEIVAINGRKATFTEDIMRYFAEEETIEVHFFHHEALKKTQITPTQTEVRIPSLTLSYFPIDEAESNVESWATLKV